MSTILFLHGWGGSRDSFASIKTYFEKSYKCIFPEFDCEPQSVLTLDDYVNQIEQIIMHEKIKQYYIIAHSFGARVAVLLSVRNPNLIQKMVCTGAAGLKPRVRLRVWFRIRLNKLRVLLLKLPPICKNEEYNKLSPAGKITFQNILRRDLSHELRLLTVQTLLIYGKKDKSTPLNMAKRWTKLQQAAKLIVYKRSGHFCFSDEPARFIRDTERFLNASCNADSD